MIGHVALTVLLGAATAAASSADAYAPYYVDCPSDIQIVREPTLSSNETAWVKGRKAVVADSLHSYLARLDLEGFNLSDYTKKIKKNGYSNVPVIAWATSGGGWRSAYTGAGGMEAIDERTPGSKEAKVGGLLQSLTYIAGLSGGSWPTASYAFYNYTSMSDIVKEWRVDIDRFTATGYSQYAAPESAYFEMIAEKYEMGFNISAADFLGLTFGYEFIPGVNRTFSSIAESESFKKFEGPLPILLTSSMNTSNSVENGLYVPDDTDPLYEWTPFEFGSWDLGFTPTKYVGSTDKDNTDNQCVVNLDQGSFVLGAVSAAFNYWWLSATTNDTLGQFSKRQSSLQKRDDDSLTGIASLESLSDAFAEFFGLTLAQIANPSIPNPFTSEDTITFADTSEAGQSVPFWPLIQPERDVDFIMAWDDDADDEPYLWTNGTNIWDTYNLAKDAGLPFPEVPPVSEMLARNYTLKPVLFGCDVSLTTTGDASSPIVAYMANAPYSYYTNYSWAAPEMTYSNFDSITENSFNLVTMGNGSLSSTWADCLGCAAIDRSLHRLGIERPAACEKCFKEHCWDGTLIGGVSEDFVLDPTLALDPTLTYAEWNKTNPNHP
ncbi:hypothetical protein N7540_008330 [Penicillium herquei]|nr:hypothetical protein N7540_008330 [Penicillium herquei]